jgi:hypothetical protein
MLSRFTVAVVVLLAAQCLIERVEGGGVLSKIPQPWRGRGKKAAAAAVHGASSDTVGKVRLPYHEPGSAPQSAIAD